MNRVSLRSNLEIKPKFNDPVILAWIRHSRRGGNGIQRHGWRLDNIEAPSPGLEPPSRNVEALNLNVEPRSLGVRPLILDV